MADFAEERRIPVILLLAGLALYIVGAFVHTGPSGVGPVMLVVGIDAIIRSILLIIAAMAIGAIFSIPFGTPASAMLKFAAIAVASGSVAFLLLNTGIGGLIGAAIFFALVMWLFELEFIYVLVLAVAYWLVGFVAGMVILSMLRS